ncbi:unnamed protein product [Gadus morhua 'NCC']
MHLLCNHFFLIINLLFVIIHIKFTYQRGHLRYRISKCNKISWGRADDLVMSLNDLLPSDLMRFLTLIISGNSDLENSEKTRCLVLSISQEENVEITNPTALFDLVQACSRENLDLALKDPSTLDILKKYEAYENKQWCRTTSIRAQYFEKMLEICDLIDDPDNSKAGKHRELERAKVKKSDLASGAPASPDVEFDVQRAEAAGKKSKEAFIQDRFVSGSSEELFFEPIKKLKLKIMDASNKTVKLTDSQGKVLQYREQSDLAFMLLIESQNLDEPLNLDELMRKPTDFKLFLANDENKTQLCKLLLEVWGSKTYASRLEKCGTAVVVVEGKAYQLKSSGGNVTTCEIAQLESTQEETDTRIVLYLLYAAHLGHKVVVVRTPDRHFLHPPAPRTIHPADLLRRHWDRKSQADLLR